ncbi:MAG: isopeptide-forming domain-containing fimbrial protein [Bacilli bacterium]|nr:isopeptide-forming domain-containing fimbrial protein [Bacilli bacterium]
MKKESKIISLVIIAIVLVGVLAFSLSTLMTNGSKLLGAVTGTNRLPSSEGTTTYKDWKESTTIDKDFSYSTLVYNDDTEFYVNITNPERTISNNAKNKDYGIYYSSGYPLADKVTPVVRLWHPTDKAQLIITNCGFDKDGNSLSAVLELSVYGTYRDTEHVTPANLEYDKLNDAMYYVEGSDRTKLSPITALGMSQTVTQNITSDGKIVFTNESLLPEGSPYMGSTKRETVRKNMPLAFNLNVEGGAADVKITYYKKLKLTDHSVVNGVNVATVDTENSQVATSITKINSAFNDFDTTPNSFSNPDKKRQDAIDAGLLFEANEGMKPLMGTSTLFYNKSGKQTLTPSDYENTVIDQANKLTFNYRMTERANGIFLNPDRSKEDKIYGKWDNLVVRLMAQGKTRKEALDYYCRYIAKCTVEYDERIDYIDGDPETTPSAAIEEQRGILASVINSSVGYYSTAGFSYLTSAQLLTTGVQGEFAFRYEMPGGGIKFGFISPQGYEFDNPVKTVAKDTIAIGEVGYFNISQPIPNNNVTNSVGFNKIYPQVFSENNHLTSFVFEDEIDKRLTVVQDGITIMTKKGQDITEYFDIAVDENNKVTATSKDNASTFFNSAEAYGTNYILQIPFMYLGAVNKYIEIPNKGKITYKVGSNNPETKETNTVKITVGEKPVKLTYDCTTNGGKAEFEPITVDQVPGTEVDLNKLCSKEGNRFLGYAEKASDKDAMTTFVMPDHDTTIYGLYTESKCDTVLNSNTYKIDQTNLIVNIPNDDSESTILKNVTSKGEVSISGDVITVKCDGSSKDYKISRYWVSKTGNEVIKWTAIISGVLLFVVAAIFIKIKVDKKKN